MSRTQIDVEVTDFPGIEMCWRFAYPYYDNQLCVDNVDSGTVHFRIHSKEIRYPIKGCLRGCGIEEGINVLPNHCMPSDGSIATVESIQKFFRPFEPAWSARP